MRLNIGISKGIGVALFVVLPLAAIYICFVDKGSVDYCKKDWENKGMYGVGGTARFELVAPAYTRRNNTVRIESDYNANRTLLALKPMWSTAGASVVSCGVGIAAERVAVPSWSMEGGRRMAVDVSYANALAATVSAPSLGYVAAAEYMNGVVVAPVRHRAPGTIGGDAQGDPTGESVWSKWLNDYYNETGNNDLSDLESWWNGKYGNNGYTPDIFTDFQNWATPVTDGAGCLIAFVLCYGIYIRYKRRYDV